MKKSISRSRAAKKSAMDQLRKEAKKIPRIEVKVTDNNREYFTQQIDSIGDPSRTDG